MPEKCKEPKVKLLAEADDKSCHQLGRVLRRDADKTNRSENCTGVL